MKIITSFAVLIMLCVGWASFCVSADYQDAPFGIHGENQYSFDNNLLGLGVTMVRYSGGLPSWDRIEKADGSFDWSQLDNLISATYRNNIKMLLTVLSFNRRDQGVSKLSLTCRKYPHNINGYLKFLKTMVERYDGDGIEDAPGSPVVEYFQIENEVDGNFWGDTPEKYAKLLTLAYAAIKEVNPNAKVVIAGASGPRGFFRFYIPVLAHLNKISASTKNTYFDIFDFHWYGNADEYKKMHGFEFGAFMRSVRSELGKYGLDGTMPILISETATFGGKGVVDLKGNALPQQDEKTQAENLIKRYIYYIANGASAVMWFKMIESHHAGEIGKGNDYFENTGLINNPQNTDGLSHAKLAYYAYKLMVEKLGGVDWKKVEIMSNGQDGTYTYKFNNQGRPVWVIWQDGRMSTVNLSVGSHKVTVTEGIPSAASGAQLTDKVSFVTEIKESKESVVPLSLGSVPVYVQEGEVSVPYYEVIKPKFSPVQSQQGQFSPRQGNVSRPAMKRRFPRRN